MNKQRKICDYTLLCLLALVFPGSSRVWVLQNTNKDLYQVGDMAVIQCKVDSDQEKVEKCTFTWTIPNPDDEHTEDILYIEKYDQRIRLRSVGGTLNILTVKNLSVADTDNLKCITDCSVDGKFTRNTGDGITLKISDKNLEWDMTEKTQTTSTNTKDKFEESKPSLSWLNFMLISINIVVFLVATFVCISLVKIQMQKKH